MDEIRQAAPSHKCVPMSLRYAAKARTMYNRSWIYAMERNGSKWGKDGVHGSEFKNVYHSIYTMSSLVNRPVVLQFNYYFRNDS